MVTKSSENTTTTKKPRLKRDYLQEEFRRVLRSKHATQEQLIKVNTALVEQLQKQLQSHDKELEILQEKMIKRAEQAASLAATKTAERATEKAVKDATKKVAKSLDL